MFFPTKPNTRSLRALWLLWALTFHLPVPAWAGIEVNGVLVPDRVNVQGRALVLNGTGTRSVFIFDIYVAALFLPRPMHDARGIVRAARPAEIRLYFLRGGPGGGLLARGWTSGFERNQEPAAMARLRNRLKRFNALFSNVRKGDVFVFDFLTDRSTQIFINGARREVIPGADFQRALLSVWLGGRPADKALKNALLGKR
jgi:hypothetical protein